jgi:hypothetical protein
MMFNRLCYDTVLASAQGRPKTVPGKLWVFEGGVAARTTNAKLEASASAAQEPVTAYGGWVLLPEASIYIAHSAEYVSGEDWRD